jgi:hypothetical protein
LSERAKNWFFAHGGRLDLETGKLVYGPKLQRAAERFAYALNASATSVFKSNREKDEMTYALETAEHGGQMRGKGAILWEHAFPNNRDTYRSHQRKKDKEAERIHRLEQVVLESREVVLESRQREIAIEARMQEEIKR